MCINFYRCALFFILIFSFQLHNIIDIFVFLGFHLMRSGSALGRLRDDRLWYLRCYLLCDFQSDRENCWSNSRFLFGLRSKRGGHNYSLRLVANIGWNIHVFHRGRSLGNRWCSLADTNQRWVATNWEIILISYNRSLLPHC